MGSNRPAPPSTSFDMCLPQEVAEISRRQLLTQGLSMTAYASVASLLWPAARARGADATAFPPQRKLVWINMSGGWDVLEVTDPKQGSTAGIDMDYSWDEA